MLPQRVTLKLLLQLPKRSPPNWLPKRMALKLQLLKHVTLKLQLQKRWSLTLQLPKQLPPNLLPK